MKDFPNSFVFIYGTNTYQMEIKMNCLIQINNEMPILTEEIKSDQKPLYVIADRFKVHKLKIRKNETTSSGIMAFLIIGDRTKHEKVFLYLLIDGEPQDGITRIKWHWKREFDREMSVYLVRSLITILRETYSIVENIVPDNKITILH